MKKRGPRRPNWPEWIDDILTSLGRAALERTFEVLKGPGKFKRGMRVSAEDLATCVVAHWIAEERSDLVKR